MEKQMKNQKTPARNQFFKLIVAGFIAAASFTSTQAQSSTELPAPQIKYIGSLGDKLVFQVDYNNESSDAFSLEIKDGQGYQFFFDRFKDKAFKKKFAIDKSELGDNAIQFTIATKDAIKKQSFDVNASYRVVEEVSVVKL